eukprot:Hpha_TRINITY_DN16462_c2_g1::TRINITY_DN16462_c2_g1_i1::g.161906::m.161906
MVAAQSDGYTVFEIMCSITETLKAVSAGDWSEETKKYISGLSGASKQEVNKTLKAAARAAHEKLIFYKMEYYGTKRAFKVVERLDHLNPSSAASRASVTFSHMTNALRGGWSDADG